MALKSIFCSSCGLEILPDDPYTFVWHEDTGDAYHDRPFVCYTFRDMGVF